MRRLAVLCAISALSAPPALAEPSRWDVAREPTLGRAERALAEATRVRLPRELPAAALTALPAFDGVLALRAAAVLEAAGGEALPSPRLWYFLGDCLIDAGGARDEDGRRVLRRALAADPDSPEAAHAWFSVAVASNRLRDFEAERAAYTAALGLEWSPEQRAGIVMNRGEAAMSLGRLADAVTDYRTALSLGGGAEVHALASFGLAAALARDGDLPAALAHAWEAVQLRFAHPLRDPRAPLVSALELPSVFFTPAFEIHFYRSLGAMATSEHAGDDAARRAALKLAATELRFYLAEAVPAGERWAERAEMLLAWCERRLSALPRAPHGRSR